MNSLGIKGKILQYILGLVGINLLYNYWYKPICYPERTYTMYVVYKIVGVY